MESAKVKLLQEDPQPFPPDMESGITRVESFEISRVRKVLVPPDAALLTTLLLRRLCPCLFDVR